MNKVVLLLILFKITMCRAEKFWWDKMISLKLTSENYKDNVGKDKYVLVEFYSKSCGYCEELYPTMNQLIAEMSTGVFPRNDITIARIDAEEFSDIADELGVEKYPTLFLYKPNDAEYPEKYDYSHKMIHIKKYLMTHQVAPNFSKGRLLVIR